MLGVALVKPAFPLGGHFETNTQDRSPFICSTGEYRYSSTIAEPAEHCPHFQIQGNNPKRILLIL
jgi:hypothetical protein